MLPETAGPDVRGSKGRIGLVHLEPNLDSIPSLCNAVELLAEAGYQVDVFTKSDSRYSAPSFGAPGVRVLTWPAHERRWARFHRLPWRWRRSLQVFWRHWSKAYKCLIGVDPAGIIEAHRLGRRWNLPLVYYSLELLLGREANSADFLAVKKQEGELCRSCSFIIIQDEERARLMSADNEVPLDKFALVPNGPLGPARRQPSGYWHRLLGLPRNCRVVLHSGGLGDWTGIGRIIESTRSWPAGWVLVVHTRCSLEESPGIQWLRDMAPPGKVFFSLQTVPRQQYDALVDGADIGIAFYVAVPGSPYAQENIRSIGLSSGKISYYLRAGLPVIVNTFASIHRLIDGGQCGLSVSDAAGIGAAIAGIERDYSRYSHNALRTFQAHLDFRRAFGAVIARIDRLERSG